MAAVRVEHMCPHNVISPDTHITVMIYKSVHGSSIDKRNNSVVNLSPTQEILVVAHPHITYICNIYCIYTLYLLCVYIYVCVFETS